MSTDEVPATVKSSEPLPSYAADFVSLTPTQLTQSDIA